MVCHRQDPSKWWYENPSRKVLRVNALSGTRARISGLDEAMARKGSGICHSKCTLKVTKAFQR
jgi:hypothetical protein